MPLIGLRSFPYVPDLLKVLFLSIGNGLNGFLVGWDWGLNSGLHACKAGAVLQPAMLNIVNFIPYQLRRYYDCSFLVH
jgi:hypothetical protein